MTITQEQFDALKKFAIDEKLSTPLVNYDTAPIVFDYSLLADMYEGEYIKHTAHLSQLIMEQLKKDHFVTFTMQDYQADSNQFDVSGITITPNEKQLEMIKRDNFGVVILGYHCLKFLNKEQYQFNYSVKKAKNDYDMFASEWKRLAPIFELHRNYNEFKKEAQEYGVADLLSAWDEPVPPPHKPENTDSRIKLIGEVYPAYFSKIASEGCEISYADYDEAIQKLMVHKMQFKLEEQQLADLKADNFAIIFDKNGFTYIANKQQTFLKQQTVEENKRYLEFRKAYSKARDRIALEKYIDQCKLQHDGLAALPFPYYVAVKVNMFLLTPNSNGTGTRKNTVQHIVVEEAFSKGRLKRNSNEFLCGGNSHYGLSSRKNDGLANDSTRYGSVPYEVTCDRCLKLAHRLLK